MNPAYRVIWCRKPSALQCPGCVEGTSGYYDFLSRIGSIWSSLRASRTRIVGIWAFSVKEINPNCSWVAYEGGLAESYLGYEGVSSDVQMIFLSAVGESCVLPSRELTPSTIAVDTRSHQSSGWDSVSKDYSSYSSYS